MLDALYDEFSACMYNNEPHFSALNQAKMLPNVSAGQSPVLIVYTGVRPIAMSSKANVQSYWYGSIMKLWKIRTELQITKFPGQGALGKATPITTPFN